MKPTILQITRSMERGGGERTALDMAKAVKNHGWNSIVASKGGLFETELKNENIKHINTHIGKFPKRPTRQNENVQKIKKIIQDNNVSLIHAHSHPVAKTALKAARQTKIPIVFNLFAAKEKNKIQTWSFRWSVNQIDATTIPSKWFKNYCENIYGINPKKLAMIYNSFDKNTFDPKNVTEKQKENLLKQWGIKNDKPIALVPARTVRWKGHKCLINAIHILKKENNLKCRFVCVGHDNGDTQYLKELKEQIKRNGLNDDVILAGDCGDMPAAYALSDVVFNPSIEPETFGYVVLEAHAMEKPVVSTALGATGEIMMTEDEYGKDKMTGWRIKPNDTKILAETIQNVFDVKPNELNEMGKRGRKFVEDKFDFDKIQEEIITLYDRLINKK